MRQSNTHAGPFCIWLERHLARLSDQKCPESRASARGSFLFAEVSACVPGLTRFNRQPCLR